MKLKNILYLGILILVIGACKKEKVGETPTPPSANKEYYLYIDFWNPDGNNPQITFDGDNSSPEVKIDFSQTFGGVVIPPNLTNVIIDNVRILDANNINYQIDEIIAYEWRNDINNWKVDVEFVMDYSQLEDLNVMLVLDASASLGDDFTLVKDYANDFVNKILTNTPNAEIGVVSFSDVINSMGLTNNQVVLSNYIGNMQQGPFTTLYEAMNVGIDSLQDNNSEGKVILTFTDGTDNNSGPEYTPEFIQNKLVNDTNSISINSFTIGLDGNGGVDKPVLEDLAANGGIAEFPNSISELGTVFDKFSKSISNVYNLTYIRNQQVIPDSTAAKLKFVIKASPK
jgi:hypothetical protein